MSTACQMAVEYERKYRDAVRKDWRTACLMKNGQEQRDDGKEHARQKTESYELTAGENEMKMKVVMNRNKSSSDANRDNDNMGEQKAEIPDKDEKCWQVLFRMQRAFQAMEHLSDNTGLKKQAEDRLFGQKNKRLSKPHKLLLGRSNGLQARSSKREKVEDTHTSHFVPRGFYTIKNTKKIVSCNGTRFKLNTDRIEVEKSKQDKQNSLFSRR